MYTQAFEQFEVINKEVLSAVEGGSKVSFGQAATAIGGCAIQGAAIGGFATGGAGFLPGAILGAQYCGAAALWALAQ